MKPWKYGFALVTCLAVESAALGDAVVAGRLQKWHRVTITFDGPENFLAYADFHGDAPVHKGPGGPRKGEAALASLHKYEPHVRDWRPGKTLTVTIRVLDE
jgi:hypothetical protein